jgi:hypothetical protein
MLESHHAHQRTQKDRRTVTTQGGNAVGAIPVVRHTCNQIHSNQAHQAGATTATMRRLFEPDPHPQGQCPHRQSSRLPDFRRRLMARRHRPSFSSRSLPPHSFRHSQATARRRRATAAHQRRAVQPGHSFSHRLMSLIVRHSHNLRRRRRHRPMACRPRATSQRSQALVVPRQGSAGHHSQGMGHLRGIPRSQDSLAGQWRRRLRRRGRAF